MPNARSLLWLVCLPLSALAVRAAAQEEKTHVHATVLHIDGDDIVIDAGRAQLDAASELTVYRALEVRHPVTRKLLRDRFAIATLRVSQAGERMSVMRLSGQPTHPLQVGDEVEVAVATQSRAAVPEAAPVTGATPAAVAASASATPSPAQTPASDKAEKQLLAYWNATLSQPPALRARYYTAYLQRFPESAYRQYVLEEIKYLEDLDAKLKQRARIFAPTAEEGTRVEMLALDTAREGYAVELAALVHPDPHFRGVLLQVRALEDTQGFRKLPMQLDARGHARAIVPADVVRAPGFAYFVESVDDAGQAHAAVGTATQPKLATVRSTARKQKPVERAARVRFSSEVVSFDGTSGRDYFVVNEGDFLYRVRRGALYGVRMGYGHLGGQGGTVQQLDIDKLAPQPAGFSYGFFEVELALHPLFGAAFRGTLGLGRPEDPAFDRTGVTGGFQARARIGEADGTHLVLAGELMPEIGQRAYIGLAWEAIERLPMQAEVVVTDQPVNTDELAVRLIYEVGYRFTDRISVALRPSYQLRTIRHAGPGIGLAATFDW